MCKLAASNGEVGECSQQGAERQVCHMSMKCSLTLTTPPAPQLLSNGAGLFLESEVKAQQEAGR